MTVPSSQPSHPDIVLSEPQGKGRWLHFLVGYAAGVAFWLLVRLLGGLNPNPCEGHTIVSLVAPLLLGPGGLGLAASQWNRPPRAIFGLGLVVASLFPALFVGSLDIAGLRAQGCAGGYVVVAPPGGRGLSELTLSRGETRVLRVRVGGFDVKARPDQFTVKAEVSNPLKVAEPPVAVTLGQAAQGQASGVRLGQEVPLTLRAAPDAAIQQYTLSVDVTQAGGRTTSGAVSVNVDDARR